MRACLLGHPRVADAAVCLMRPEEGSRLKVFVVPRPEAPPPQTWRQELLGWIEARLTPPEGPRVLRFGPALPTGPMGKAADWDAQGAIDRRAARPGQDADGCRPSPDKPPPKQVFILPATSHGAAVTWAAPLLPLGSFPRPLSVHAPSPPDLLPLTAASLCGELAEAQARRIRDLERRLAERTRVLTEVAEALAGEIRHRERVQAALYEAQKIESIGHLAGGLAHDLRNALDVLAFGCEILRVKTTDGDLLRVAESGHRALEQSRSLIEGMLNLVRRRDGDPRLLAPGDWLPGMADLLGYAAGRRLACRVETAAHAWPVRVDEHRLGAALVNLVANARDATRDGGEVVVQVANLPRGAERPAAVPEGDRVVFSVIDTGCGMSPEVLSRATDPLFTTKPPDRGTGLGLAMVQAFAAGCAGHLVIESAPDEGTRVSLYLPRASDPPPAEAGASPAGPQARQAVEPMLRRGAPASIDASADRAAMPAAAQPPSPGCAGTALLADGDDLGRCAAAAMLRAEGFQVVEATGAEVALALLYTLPRLDLAVVDGALAERTARDGRSPGREGPTLVERLRWERPGLPVLILGGTGGGDGSSDGGDDAGGAAGGETGGRPVLPGPGLPDPTGPDPLGWATLARPFDREGLADAARRAMGSAPEAPHLDPRRQAELLDRLALRLRSADLLAALLAWRGTRGAGRLPDPDAVRDAVLGAVPALADRCFVALAEGPAEEPRFRFLSVGAALVARLGRPLAGERVGPEEDDTPGTLAGAYRRAARTGLPSYEYLRFALGDGSPLRFERLILPASRDGRTVSHLLGIALFADAPERAPGAGPGTQVGET